MPTAFRRGEIRLANFNPSKGTEAGKIRPCLILQSDLLNEDGHASTTRQCPARISDSSVHNPLRPLWGLICRTLLVSTAGSVLTLARA